MTAWMLLRAALSRITEAAGVLSLAVLLWLMMFAVEPRLEQGALIVGLLGVIAALTTGARWPRPLVITLAAFAVANLVSASVHPITGGEPGLGGYAGAWPVLVMMVFVLGAGHLLASPPRLALLVIGIVASALVMGVKVFLDQVSLGFVVSRAGVLSLPSIPQWGGIHAVSLVFEMAFLCVLAVPLARPRMLPIASSLVLGGLILGVTFMNGSRGGMAAMAAATVMVAVVSQIRRRSWAARLAVATVALSVAAVVAVALFRGRMNLIGINFLSNREGAWGEGIRLFREAPVIGVGPANYATANYARGWTEVFPNAHNMWLHTAAETGIVGAAALTAFLLVLGDLCRRAWASGRLPVMSLAITGSVLVLLGHSVNEHFLNARAEVGRTRLLFWMSFAAVVALHRVSAEVSRD